MQTLQTHTGTSSCAWRDQPNQSCHSCSTGCWSCRRTLPGSNQAKQAIFFPKFARPELEKDVHHPKPLFLRVSILLILLRRLGALLGVVLEDIKGDALQTNLFAIINEHCRIQDINCMPLNVVLIVVHACYIILTSLDEFYLVLDGFFQLLVVEFVLHELFYISHWYIFFDVLCRIHILGKVGGKLIPEEWEIVIFIVVEGVFPPSAVVDLVFIMHILIIVWTVHGLGERGSGFVCQAVLLGSMFDPTNGRGALLLFDCQIFDDSIDVSDIDESNWRQLPFSGLVLAVQIRCW